MEGGICCFGIKWTALCSWILMATTYPKVFKYPGTFISLNSFFFVGNFACFYFICLSVCFDRLNFEHLQMASNEES